MKVIDWFMAFLKMETEQFEWHFHHRYKIPDEANEALDAILALAED